MSAGLFFNCQIHFALNFITIFQKIPLTYKYSIPCASTIAFACRWRPPAEVHVLFFKIVYDAWFSRLPFHFLWLCLHKLLWWWNWFSDNLTVKCIPSLMFKLLMRLKKAVKNNLFCYYLIKEKPLLCSRKYLCFIIFFQCLVNIA